MRAKLDLLSEKILNLINKVDEPLETTEIEEKFPTQTRIKLLYRLNKLRGDQLIKGKQVGSGKGAWIWWCIK
jgi:hypothetical protein